MKLHTTLTRTDINTAYRDVRDIGHIPYDVSIFKMDDQASRSHPCGYLIKLGTYDGTSGPSKIRYRLNTGKWGLDRTVFAATYDEWGWFIARIFELDPNAKWSNSSGIRYADAEDFIKKTNGKFPVRLPDERMWYVTAHP